MSNKGKTFTRADLPRITQQRIANKQVSETELARLDKWLADQTERNRVVAMDGGTAIIAEELDERLIRLHAEGDAEVLVQLRNLMRLTPEQRVYVLESFEEDGELVNPLPPPKKAKK